MSSTPEKALHLSRPHRRHYHKTKPRRPRWSWLWWFAAAVTAFVVGRTTAPQSVTPPPVSTHAAIAEPKLKTEISRPWTSEPRLISSPRGDKNTSLMAEAEASGSRSHPKSATFTPVAAVTSGTVRATASDPD